MSDPRDAEVILFLGSDAPATSMDEYRHLLSGISLPAICCNPDKLMLTPRGLQPAPGAIASLYEELGGKVTWIGKPYAAIYEHALQVIGNPRRVLCIGDSAEHDVAGGRMPAFRSCWSEPGFQRASIISIRSPTSLPTASLGEQLHLVMSHSCFGSLWNFHVRFGPAITLR